MLLSVSSHQNPFLSGGNADEGSQEQDGQLHSHSMKQSILKYCNHIQGIAVELLKNFKVHGAKKHLSELKGSSCQI